MRLFEIEWSWASQPLRQPWHSTLLALFAVALFAACAYGYKSTRDFLQAAQGATGIVVDVVADSDEVTHPRVRFVDVAGHSHEFDSDLKSHPPRYSVGERVSVLYLAGAPQNARIEGFVELWLQPLITGVIGLALSAAAILTWIFRDALFRKTR